MSKLILDCRFLPIFCDGLLFWFLISPICLEKEKIDELIQYSIRKENIEINLLKQEIIFGNKRIKFEIDSFKKKCLLEGLDDIALSLEKSEKIDLYEEQLKKNKPWEN